MTTSGNPACRLKVNPAAAPRIPQESPPDREDAYRKHIQNPLTGIKGLWNRYSVKNSDQLETNRKKVLKKSLSGKQKLEPGPSAIFPPLKEGKSPLPFPEVSAIHKRLTER